MTLVCTSIWSLDNMGNRAEAVISRLSPLSSPLSNPLMKMRGPISETIFRPLILSHRLRDDVLFMGK